MPYSLSKDGLCVIKEDGSPVDGGCHDTRDEAVKHLAALNANVPDAKEKALVNSPLNLIVGKIHQAYTVAADELFMRGYMTQDERKAIGGLIGELLGNFREALITELPTLERTVVDAEDVEKIVELFTMKQSNPIQSLLDSILLPFTAKAGARHSKTDKDKIQTVHDHAVDLGASCPMTVFKQADGKHRWVLMSSTAFEDKDGEIVSIKAQEQDTNAMSAANDYGVLRWWHVGKPYAQKQNDWQTWTAGKGVDLGVCDFSAMHNRVRIESGTFYNEQVGARLKEVADQLSVSIGFSHPENEPNSGGVFENIHTFERSLLPRGKQSNYFVSSPLIAKESNMDTTKLDKFKELMGGMAALVLNQAEQTDKAAEQSGATFKAKTVADMDEVELKSFIVKCMDEYAQTDKAKSEKETQIVSTLETLSASLVTLKSNDEQIATALNAMGKTMKANADAVAALQGDLPKSLASLKRSNADDNIVSDAKVKEVINQIAQPTGQFDFFNWAATGTEKANAVPAG